MDYRKPIVFTGKVGSEEYKNKITTAGRLRLSKILDADIDKIQDPSGKPILKWPDRISAGSGAKIYQWTYDQPDGVEKMNALQKFGLHVVTVLGNVSLIIGETKIIQIARKDLILISSLHQFNDYMIK